MSYLKIFKLTDGNFDCFGSYLGSSLCPEKMDILTEGEGHISKHAI